MEVIELTASRKKEALLLLLAAILLAATIFAVAAPNDGSSKPSWAIWLGLPLWSSAFVLFGWQTIKPPRLILDKEGFTFTGNLRTQRVAWHDVEEFFVWHSGRGNRFIGYKLKPEARINTIIARVNNRFGADGILPSVWPMSAEALASKLNAVTRGGLGQMQIS